MEARATGFLYPPPLPYPTLLPPPAPSRPVGFDLNNRLSPSMLLIIIILAVIIFISGVLHLLVRFLLRPPRLDPDQDGDVSPLQGQLQQLFHLHDAGVDQSFIDALPVFDYKAIVGVKDPFDCAVCLCEFEPDDNLRLLPKCSHAFHVDCIDTWLLSHSTCPLCRTSLLADFPPLAGCAPVVLVLESCESSREIISDYNNITTNNSDDRVSSHSSDEFGAGKSSEIQSKDEGNCKPSEKVLSVKLGKFRNVNGGGNNYCSGDGNYNASPRRCFSMGSFAYVMDEGSSLWVPIRTPTAKQLGKKKPLPLRPGHRPAMSECGSSREYNGFEANRFLEIQESKERYSFDDVSENRKSVIKESFSMSKIWTRDGKRDKPEGSRRAFSFRFPTHRGSTSGGDVKGKGGGRRVLSEIDMGRWGSGGASSDSEGNVASFGRRTVLWIMGRPSKVVDSSASSYL